VSTDVSLPVMALGHEGSRLRNYLPQTDVGRTVVQCRRGKI
jgi:hypothetical protein